MINTASTLALTPMKIATWNVNSLKVRLPHVLYWLNTERPNVLGLQETKLTDEKFPVEEIEAAGYHVSFFGQKTYNGVAMLASTPMTDVLCDVPHLDDPDRRILAATIGTVRVLNLYVVNGKEVGSDKYAHKLNWLSHVSDFVHAEIKRHPHLVVIGDFNIAPEDRDIHDPDAWREKILCSTPEREALKTMMDAGLTDTYRLFDQEPESFSWWDYRAGGFRRNRGLRIDLILASADLSKNCTECRIDVGPRKLERPSDHAPVVATFAVDT